MSAGRVQEKRVIDLTLLVPCFNEGERLDRCVYRLRDWFATHPILRAEVLLIDDGSTDDTPSRMARLGEDWTLVRSLRLPRNRGKGAALRAGMAEAKGARVLFLDTDLAVRPSAIGPALARLDAGADLVVGCRNIPGAEIRRPQGRIRRTLGRFYLGFARRVLGLEPPDITCGFKAFRQDVGKRLFAASRCNRFGFDAEILRIAAESGDRIETLPVVWEDSGRSAVRVLRDGTRALGELAAVRWRAWTGAYRSAVAPPASTKAGSAAEDATRVEPAKVALSDARPASTRGD